MDLPIFSLQISEDMESKVEIDFISMVERPAIQRNFLAFNTATRLAFSDDERRIITGPAMIPDMPIYREDPKMGQYYVVFDQANVLRAAQKFMAKGYSARMNLAHNRDAVPKGVFVFESFVTDKKRGILSPEGFKDLPDGTWFVSASVQDPETWAGVKSGTYRGFSVEGMFIMDVNPALQPETLLAEIEKILAD
jgi:hypothetical protein